MDDPKGSKLKVWSPLLFSFVMIAGMVLGFNLRDTLRSKRDIQSVIERNDRLEQIIDLINEKYVDTVNTNALYEDAVNGILSHLDPHTVYITPEEMQSVTEDMEGSFFGIGVEFSIVRDTIQITSVVDGGPAQRAGVNMGDRLIRVEDSLVAGTGITSDRIIKMLRGKQYSKVLVSMLPADGGAIRKVVIERDAIPLYSVEASLMLDEQIGYIKINRFSATTYEEFLKAMKELEDSGARSLILDLRQNPGGYLDAATEIADEFLDNEKLIVYTEGRRSPRQEYTASRKGAFEQGKLAVLVDESSASASEIIAGAVQDWDRGIIVGRRTYGKGLVQEQFEMDNGAALRLTIAKYYTPSGRSIQRSYARGKEAYDDDLTRRFHLGALTGRDTTLSEDTSVYYTHSKRVVHGGGGITPDVYVPYDTSKLSVPVLNVIFSESTRTFLWDYYLRNRQLLKQYRDVTAFDRHFTGEDVIASFSRTVPAGLKDAYRITMERPATSRYFRLQMKAQLARFLYRNDGFYAINAQSDDVIQKALESLRGKQYSSLIGRQAVQPVD